MLVRPDDAGPTISVSAPRGTPPVSASSSVIPNGTISGAGRTSSAEAGFTPGMANVPCGGRRTATSAAKANELRAAEVMITLRKGAAGKQKQEELCANYMPERAGIQPAGLVQNPLYTFAFYSPTSGILLPPDEVVKMKNLPDFSLSFGLLHRLMQL